MSYNVGDSEIVYNSVVLSGFEFVEKRPLGFFEFEDQNDKTIIFDKVSIGSEAKGTLKVKEYGFEPSYDEEGNLFSDEVCIVSRAKARPVLIFQDNEFSREYHDNVFVIPIQSLDKPDRSKFKEAEKYKVRLEYYDKIIQRSEEVYNLYYFPKNLKDGHVKDRVLVLSDARFIHKSMLFKQKDENGLGSKDIEQINIRLSKMLNIKNIEECKTCKHNCEKCEYIYMFDSLKKIMGRVERTKKEA